MSLAVLRPLAFGEVLDQSFGLYRRLFLPLLVLSIGLSGVPALIMLSATVQGGVMEAPVIWTAGFLLSVVAGSFATAASTYLVAGYMLGRPITTGEALTRALPKVLPLILTSLLFGLVVGLGFVALIVPGIIAAAGLVLCFTAITVEDLGPTAALGRAWELSKGFKGRIFGLFFVFTVVTYIAMIGAGILAAIAIPGSGESIVAAAAAGDGSVPMALIVLTAVTSLIQLVLYPLLYCILVTVYYDLRVRKEGFDLELLATTMERPVPR